MMRNDPGAVSALRFRSIVLCLLAFSTVPIQAAQESKGTAVSKVERKNRAPVSKEVLQPKLPRPQEVVLENGLTVLVLEDGRFPLVSVYLQIDGAGPIYEPRESAGLAHVAARMLVEGTKKRSSQQIAEEIEALGASLSASASFGSAAAVIRGSGLSENIEPLFALLTDVLLHPTFPEGELNKLRPKLSD
jgi:zinc protease